MSPGISCSARRISFRPSSWLDRSLTLKSTPSTRVPPPPALPPLLGLLLVVIVVTASLLSSIHMDRVGHGPLRLRLHPPDPGEQARAAGPRLRRQDLHPHLLEARPAQHSAHLLHWKPQPLVPHRGPVLLAPVLHHVHNQRHTPATLGPQHPPHFAHR